MAICYKCGERFYGHTCPSCGWMATYNCWQCKTEIVTEHNKLCGQCKWFICHRCNECGCNENRPLSNEEREDQVLY